MTYYERQSTAYLDGSPVFQTPEDQENEGSVAAMISERWNCEIRSFGSLAPLDWYAQRHGRLIGLLELKSRSHVRDKYPSVFLNTRKWLALVMGSLGMGVPAVFVVRFADGVYWVPVGRVDARCNRIAGCYRILKSVNDIEPIIEIPIGEFVPLSARELAA